MVLINCLKKIFSTEYMVKPSERLGEIPGDKEAYSSFVKLAWPAMIESMFVAMAALLIQ